MKTEKKKEKISKHNYWKVQVNFFGQPVLFIQTINVR